MFSFFKKINDNGSKGKGLDIMLLELKRLQQNTSGRVEISIFTTPIEVEDAKDIFEMSKVDENFKVALFKNSKDVGSTEEEIRLFITYQSNDENCFIQMIKLAIFENGIKKSSSEVSIGFIALMHTSNITDVLVLGSHHHLLFSIRPEYRGKGFMKNALMLMLNEMYRSGYNICAALIKQGNATSEHILQNAGFVKNGRKNNDTIGYFKRLNMDLRSFEELVQ